MHYQMLSTQSKEDLLLLASAYVETEEARINKRKSWHREGSRKEKRNRQIESEIGRMSHIIADTDAKIIACEFISNEERVVQSDMIVRRDKEIARYRELLEKEKGVYVRMTVN